MVYRSYSCPSPRRKVIGRRLAQVVPCARMSFLTGFKDRVALVTGGGRGIGRSTSVLLAQLGARVSVNYLANDEAARDTLKEINQKGGYGFLVKGDVSKDEDVAAVVRQTVETYGSIDILVNSAGLTSQKSLEEVTLEDWNHMIAVNLTGTFLMCKAVLPLMKKKGYGRIVNLASIAGMTGALSGPHYSAAKGGVVALTRKLALDGAPHGVVVNCVAPGMIETDMLNAWLKTPELKKQMMQLHPVGRLGTPWEIACLITYLSSKEAGFINGETVNINGGRFIR